MPASFRFPSNASALWTPGRFRETAYQDRNNNVLNVVARLAPGRTLEEARAEFDGVRSIIVSVQRQPDANTVAVTDAINALIPEFQRLLPPTVKLSVLSDRSESIRAAEMGA